LATLEIDSGEDFENDLLCGSYPHSKIESPFVKISLAFTVFDKIS